MNTAKRLGLLFLLLGIVILIAALAPVLQHPPTAINIWVLLAGIAVSILGALMIPNSGADKAIDKIAVTVQNTNIPFVGGGGDRSAARSTTATTTVTVETPKPPVAP